MVNDLPGDDTKSLWYFPVGMEADELVSRLMLV